MGNAGPPASRVVYRALSLGAGVQSSVLALLLSRSDQRLMELGYPRPDCAIFADTGWEPAYVYEHLNWLESELSFPLVRVSAGSLKRNLKSGRTVKGRQFVDVPFFVVDQGGKRGMLRRCCTTDYKVKPIHQEVRKRAGVELGRRFPKGTHVEMWLGISVDEAARMKPSREAWVEFRWPLIDLDMTRGECLSWFESEFPERRLPRSACVICPYRSDDNWIEMRELDPQSYQEAVRFDTWLRNSTKNPVRRILSGRPYLHKSRRPLASAIDCYEHSRLSQDTVNQFVNECEGLCGV